MSQSRRPRTLAERAEVCASVLGYPLRADADAAVTAVLSRTISTAALEWTTARDAWVSADAAYNQALDALGTADAAFDTTLDALSWTVKDAAGRPGTLTELLGGAPVSSVKELKAARAVLLATECLERLPSSGLRYDATAAAQLATAVEALSAANTAALAANGLRRTTRDTLTACEPALDEACTKAVRAVTAMVGEAATNSIFPLFVRSEPPTTPK